MVLTKTTEMYIQEVSMFNDDEKLITVPNHQELIEKVDKYLGDNNINPHDFGKKHFNDSGLIPRLKEGRDPRLSTVIKIMNVIEGK